jgi:hypothetical protein
MLYWCSGAFACTDCDVWWTFAGSSNPHSTHCCLIGLYGAIRGLFGDKVDDGIMTRGVMSHTLLCSASLHAT